MRFALAVGLVLTGFISGFAADPPASTSPAKPPPGGANSVIAGSDRSAFAAKKPKIEDLMKLDRFTNATGIIMIRVSDKLWVGQTLVTQEQYQKVSGGNPSQAQGARNPVDSVSWRDALDFCARLGDAERKEEMLPEGFAYTLPTQSQWESFVSGATLDSAVTSFDMIRGGPAPVASKAPNSLGLYDIRGNLWQWCLDPQDKPYRVLRGGAWNEYREMNLRPEFRWYSNGPDDRQNIFGFRIILAGG